MTSAPGIESKPALSSIRPVPGPEPLLEPAGDPIDGLALPGQATEGVIRPLDEFDLTTPVSYTHLTLPTIYSV